MSNFTGTGITINGNAFDGNFIAPNTWKVKREKRLVRSWTDMLGNIHEDYYPNKKAKISFGIRKHTEAEHEEIIAFFSSVNNVSVSFWDDSTNEYVTAVVRINVPEWLHQVTRVGGIIYAETAIEMEEY